MDVKHLKSGFSLLEWEIMDKQGEEDKKDSLGNGFIKSLKSHYEIKFSLA